MFTKIWQKVLISIVVVAILAGIGIYSSIKLPIIRRIEYLYAHNYEDDRIMVGTSDNVFVAKILRKIGEEPEPWSSLGLIATYEAEIIHNIKGDLSGIVTIAQEVGYKEGIFYTEMAKDYSPLQAGKTYLLCTRIYMDTDYHMVGTHPNSQKLISKNNASKEELKTLAINSDRVKEFQKAYKNQITEKELREKGE